MKQSTSNSSGASQYKAAVIFHSGCLDGLGAAWAASLQLGVEGVFYYPSLHDQDFPADIIPESIPVYIFDFSYDRQTIINLEKRQKGRLLVLDHHKTAQRDLEGLNFCQIDLSRSGAVLSWQYFHPQKPIPRLLEYIQDRDLWSWELPNSKEIDSYIRSRTNISTFKPSVAFNEFQSLAKLLETDFQSAVNEGLAICRYRDQQVDIVCQKANQINLAGHQIMAANSVILESEIGARLLDLHPDIPFSGIWSLDRPGICRWSLRSRKGTFDVSEIAKSFGGGGHPGASGFCCQLNDPQLKMLFPQQGNQLK